MKPRCVPVRALVLLLLVAGCLPAQFVSAVISPNPAPVGATVTVTITPRIDIVLTTDCVIRRVRKDRPDGAPVFTPNCLNNPVTILACANASATWNGTVQSGANATPGDYWVVVQYLDVAGVQPPWMPFEDAFPVTVEGSTQEPTLSAPVAPLLGTPLNLSIAAPLAPNAPYVTVFSFTSTTGLQITGQEYLAVDLDPVFFLSFPAPDPTLFVNTIGVLDAAGAAGGIQVNLPNIPFLQCRSLIAQAVLAGPNGVELTNGLSFTLQ